MKLGWIVAATLCACGGKKDQPKPAVSLDAAVAAVDAAARPSGPQLVTGGVDLGLDAIEVTVAGTFVISRDGDAWIVEPDPPVGARYRIYPSVATAEPVDTLILPHLRLDDPTVKGRAPETAWKQGVEVANASSITTGADGQKIGRDFLAFGSAGRGQLIVAEIEDPERSTAFLEASADAFSKWRPRAR